MVQMDAANMALAKALILLGIGFAAVAMSVRKKDGTTPSRQAIRELSLSGFRALKGPLGRPKNTKILKKPQLAKIKATMLKLRGPSGKSIGYLAVYKKLPMTILRKAKYSMVRKALIGMGFKYLERPQVNDPIIAHKKKRIQFVTKHANRTPAQWVQHVQAVGDIHNATWSPGRLAIIAHRNRTKRTLMKVDERARFARPRNGLTKDQRKKQRKLKLLVFISPSGNGSCLVVPLPTPYTAQTLGKVFSKRVIPWLQTLYPEKSQHLPCIFRFFGIIHKESMKLLSCSGRAPNLQM